MPPKASPNPISGRKTRTTARKSVRTPTATVSNITASTEPASLERSEVNSFEENRILVCQKDETLAAKVEDDSAREATAPENDGSSLTKGGKTVARKMVRLVKKKVVKKVPKRVQKYKAGIETPNPSDLGAIGVPKSDSDVANSNASDTLELENTDSGSAIPMDTENPNSHYNASVLVAVENVNTNTKKEDNASTILSSPEINNVKEPDAAEVEGNDSIKANLMEAPVSDSMECDSNENEGRQHVSTSQNVGFDGSQEDKTEVENMNAEGSERKVGAKNEVESCQVSDLKGDALKADQMVLSGEMEALERRKRRKTEIFVGGLDKDAKEEDVRKVFEEVGEILEVTLRVNEKTGKNRGFAFLRYASAADAKKALEKFAKVEICGKQCSAAPVEGNDTIFLGNIDKKWKNEDIVKLLQDIGVGKIDKVTVIADPSNIERNRGFAFVELETIRDAQIAFRILEKKGFFGKHQKIRVAWAEPLSEPGEEEMHKVKTVYAEYLPASWDEEKVKDHFKKFGEIENVVLAKNLHSSRRKDFAYVNYSTREAALACIEAFNHESLNDEGSKVNVKVSLAKPIPKGKQVKRALNPASKIPPKEKQKAAKTVIMPNQLRSKGGSASRNYDNIRGKSSTTDELVHLLREQASWRQQETALGVGSADLDYAYPLPARKRQLSLLGDDPVYSNPRGYPRSRTEGVFPAVHPSGFSPDVGMTSFPYYHRQDFSYPSALPYGADGYPNSSQTRGAALFNGRSSVYRRH